jgi:DNA-binding transcriptional LysR family regulator
MTKVFPSFGLTPLVHVEEQSLEGVLEAVVEGRGVALLPATLENIYRSTGVAFTSIEPPGPYLDQGVVWAAGAASPALQLMLDLSCELSDTGVEESVS